MLDVNSHMPTCTKGNRKYAFLPSKNFHHKPKITPKLSHCYNVFKDLFYSILPNNQIVFLLLGFFLPLPNLSRKFIPHLPFCFLPEPCLPVSWVNLKSTRWGSCQCPLLQVIPRFYTTHNCLSNILCSSYGKLCAVYGFVSLVWHDIWELSPVANWVDFQLPNGNYRTLFHLLQVPDGTRDGRAA